MPGPFDEPAIDTGHPGYAAFQATQPKLNAAMNAQSVQDWIALLQNLPNPTSGERQLLIELTANPDKYEVKGGHLRKKTPLDFVGNHPWLTTAAFLGAASAPALFGGDVAAAGGGAPGVSSSGVSTGLLPSAHLSGQALNAASGIGVLSANDATFAALAYGGSPASIASQGISRGIPYAGGAAGGGGIASSILNWLKQPRNIMGLAAAVPLGINAFRGGGGGGGGGTGDMTGTEKDLLDEIKTNLGLQRGRFQAAQPAFDAAQRLAVSMAPTSARGPS